MSSDLSLEWRVTPGQGWWMKRKFENFVAVFFSKMAFMSKFETIERGFVFSFKVVVLKAQKKNF